MLIDIIRSTLKDGKIYLTDMTEDANSKIVPKII